MYIRSLIVLTFFCAININGLKLNFALTDSLTLSWALDNATQTIAISMELQNSQSWVGIGWHCVGCTETGMTKADIVLGIFDANGQVQVYDYFASNLSNGFTRPVPDEYFGGYDNILSYMGYQDNSYTYFSFTRNLVTNDTKADHPFQNGNMRVIWAHGSSNTFGFHDTNAGSAVINFFTGQASVVKSNLKYWHGSLMVAAFGFFMTVAIFIARYLKAYRWWFPLHIAMQVVGMILAIAAFGVAIKMTDGTHFSSTHSWFGLATMGVMVISPMLGWAGDILYDPKRTSIPIWPDQVHWWAGRCTVALSYVTIIMGMHLFGLPAGPKWVFGISFSVFIILCFFVDMYKRMKQSNEMDTDHKPLMHVDNN